MSSVPHILVIGAGLIGLSSADALQAGGAKVTVIDEKKGPALGASFSNSGMIHPSQAAPWLKGDFGQAAQAVFELAKRSQILLAARLEAFGLVGATRAAGCLQLFQNERAARKAAKRYENLGVICEDATGRDHTFGHFALFFPGDRSADAYTYCRALESDLKMRGVEVLYGVKDRPDMNRSFDHIVIAAGTGSREVASRFEVDLPVKPLRGHALNFARPSIALPDIPVMDFESHSALTPFEDKIRLSGTVDKTDPDCLVSIWRDIAPDLIAALGPVTSSWSEDRPASAAGRPIITKLKPGLWVNSGHGHMGWTLSAASGELMAKMILGGHKNKSFCLIS